MMAEKAKFDAAQVGSLATEIAALTAEVMKLKKEAEVASSLSSSAECRLQNKRSELTRAVESQLDRSLIRLMAVAS